MIELENDHERDKLAASEQCEYLFIFFKSLYLQGDFKYLMVWW